MADPAHHQIAATLVEALPYMRRFAGSTFVVKYGGHAMGSAALAEGFARDVVLLKQVGINPVVVHGGGPQIKAMLDRLKIKSEFVEGLRVTDSATVEIVEMVLAGSINKQIVAAIHAVGGQAVGLSGKDAQLIEAAKLTRSRRDPQSSIEQVLDLGFVGEPVRIRTRVLEVLAGSEIVPVIAPIGLGLDGHTYNINADTAAGAIAAALHARKLVLLTDVAGVLDGAGRLISELSAAEARALLADGTVSGGMIPKLRAGVTAAEAGTRCCIVDGRVGRALRSVTKLDLLGERNFIVDCDVLKADGGTRTAAITGSCVALAQALERLVKAGTVAALPMAPSTWKRHVTNADAIDRRNIGTRSRISRQSSSSARATTSSSSRAGSRSAALRRGASALGPSPRWRTPSATLATGVRMMTP